MTRVGDVLRQWGDVAEGGFKGAASKARERVLREPVVESLAAAVAVEEGDEGEL